MTGLSRRRAVLGLTASALGLALPSLALPSVAHASLFRALTLAELSQGSSRIVRGTPVENFSEWDTSTGRKRIVTYTRVLVGEDIGAPADDSEVMVMTWGGRIGDIAQLIHGEAALRPDEESVLFLSGERGGARRLTAMAQAHYPITRTGRVARLQRSRQLDGLVARDRAAVDTLHDRSFDEAKGLIRGALK